MELTINGFDSIAFHKCAQMFAIHLIEWIEWQPSERARSRKETIFTKTRFTWICDDCCRLLIKTKTPKNAHVWLYRDGMVANCT